MTRHSRIEAAFSRLREQGRTGLIPFLTVGFPDIQSTLELVPALQEGGADLIELGVPYSDPLADGATIQRASEAALRNGVTLAACLEVVRALRQKDVTVPLLLMGYYNPLLQYSRAVHATPNGGPPTQALDRFCADAAAAGVDGLIVADLPPEEANDLRRACRGHGLDLVFLLAPTSSNERVKRVCRLASGFIYCVSLTGVTGARQALPETVPAMLARIRRHTRLPLAVGFGISSPEHVRALAGHAEAAIVGSALIQAIEQTAPEARAQRLRAFIGDLKAAGAPVSPP